MTVEDRESYRDRCSYATSSRVWWVIRTLVKTERWARKTPVVREVVWCLLHDVADRTRARRGLCLGHVGVRCIGV